MKSGTHVLSTGNEPANLCQEKTITIDEPTNKVTVEMPGRSLNTYIFIIDREETAICDLKSDDSRTSEIEYYDLQGRRITVPHGLCIEKRADGTSRKVYLNRGEM